ncbi:MAG: hypothetical protein H6668_22125 [Ardenticatenaceae bacterium]|nr:hypothetical protein [Ardenticatenaceae bacterium]
MVFGSVAHPSSQIRCLLSGTAVPSTPSFYPTFAPTTDPPPNPPCLLAPPCPPSWRSHRPFHTHSTATDFVVPGHHRTVANRYPHPIAWVVTLRHPSPDPSASLTPTPTATTGAGTPTATPGGGSGVPTSTPLPVRHCLPRRRRLSGQPEATATSSSGYP